MIFITGDAHADFYRFGEDSFYEQKEMTRDDYLIICGDFGGVWNFSGESHDEKKWLDWLEGRSYTTLFVDGNHENFDQLYKYPVKEWHGGKVHEVRPHVLHLMRGEIFDIDGLSFFAFGGARSHDIEGGILELDDPDIFEKKHALEDQMINYRVNHLTWWREEEPSRGEMEYGLDNLAKHGNKVDFIISHDCAASTLALMYHGRADTYDLSRYLEQVHQTVEFKKHFFGHHHIDWAINDKDICLYEQIVQIS